MTMTFLNRLSENCRALSPKVALEFVGDGPGAGRTVTYGQLEERVTRTMAYLLDRGVEPGDRVALQLPKGLPFICLHLAVMRLGAISLPLNPGYPPRELRYFLQDAAAKLFFGDLAAREPIERLMIGQQAELPELEEIVLVDDEQFAALIAGYDPAIGAAVPIPQDPGATCLMIYTSGTTGRPKGAELTHGNLTAQINALDEAWGWREDDVLLHVLPIFHVHGLIVALHGALNAGATTLLLDKFDAARVLALLEERRCTVFMAVPTIHRRLLDAPNARTTDLSRVRLMTSGSDRLPDDVFLAYQETFGHTLLERYGMSETGMNLSNPLAGERRVGSVGLPLPGVEARIVHPETEAPLADDEVGEVQIRGPHVCKGYWRQPDKTVAAFTADGWLRTGDMGTRSSDGYFTLKGRAKDLIISGGYNIYPPEVELVLAEHPAIAASAVIGCPDAEWGERVTALVIVRPDAQVSEEEVITFCRERLIGYKVPRAVRFVDEFPRNALGKVQKAQLRAEFCAG
ncbi:MAG: AMP-binding protein [Caldilineaceae bacterium]|nr:AMP-binding protein [Caldilineaceae bacterium]